MIDSKIWIQNLENALINLSDINFQKKYWLQSNNDGICSSYVETVNYFLDDINIDILLNRDWNKFGLSQRLNLRLKNLVNLVRNYDDGYQSGNPKSDLEILQDINWHKIIRVSNLCLRSLIKERNSPIKIHNEY